MLRIGELDRLAVGLLFSRFGLALRLVPHGEDIPGSYWGETEAGLKGSTL
jgi:hypothetical protein